MNGSRQTAVRRPRSHVGHGRFGYGYKSTGARCHARLACETLEQRRVLSGDLLGQFVGGEYLDDSAAATPAVMALAEGMSSLVENGAPTLELNTLVSSVPENYDTTNGLWVANILVLDDLVGENQLSLTGSEADSFEIVAGTQLHLRPGTVLDYETLASYSVVVEVDDPTVGTTPDDAVGMTLTVTDVYEPLWHNATDRYDVNASDSITPVDALIIINHINAHPFSDSLPDPSTGPPPYLDVNADDLCTPVDVLIVVNHLNMMLIIGGEPWSAGASTVATASETLSAWEPEAEELSARLLAMPESELASPELLQVEAVPAWMRTADAKWQLAAAELSSTEELELDVVELELVVEALAADVGEHWNA